MEPEEMRRHPSPLADDTADRLLDGRVDQHGAPPGHAATAALLSAAATPPPVVEIDDALLQSMLEAIGTSPALSRGAQPARSRRVTARLAAAAAAVVIGTGGAAAAATGNLPAPAQDAISKAVGHLGVDLPMSDDQGADEPSTGERPIDARPAADQPPDGAARTTGNVDNPTDRDQHGADVSDTARTTETTGADKGAAISEVARNGHGPAASSTTVPDDDAGDDDDEGGRGKPADPGAQAPVDTPNDRSAGTAGDAGGGRSDTGADRRSGSRP